jgi:CHAT domain-containing protein/Flp pilus assembly protein TadD
MKKIIPLVVFLMVLGVNAANAEDVDVEIQQLQKALALNPNDAGLLNETGLALYDAGNYAKAEPLLLKSFTIWEKTLAKDHPAVAERLEELAQFYYVQDKYAQAEPFYQRRLAILEKNWGQEHIDVALELNWLANFYKKQEKYDQAEPLYQRSLAILEKKWGQNHIEITLRLKKLADFYKRQEKYEQAEPLYQRSLAILEKNLGEDHIDVALRLEKLADFYKRQEKYEQAEPLYQRSLAILEKNLGEDHIDVAESLKKLADFYKKQGKYGHAEPLYQRSLAIVEKSLDQESNNVTLQLEKSADFYRRQGKYEQAESLYQRSLAILEKNLGKEHKKVALRLEKLADFYKRQEKYDQAEPLYQRSLAILEKSLGEEYEDVALRLEKLAKFYKTQEKYEQAESLYQHSLAILEKNLGEDHIDVAKSLNKLANLYKRQKKYEQAEPLLKRVLAIREKNLGKDHSGVATALSNLAGLYETQGKYSEAESFYQRSLAIREKVLGKYDEDVSNSLKILAKLYETQGKYNEAESFYQRNLEVREKILGKNHEEVAVTLNELAKFYETQHKYKEAGDLYQRSLEIREKTGVGKYKNREVIRSLEALIKVYQAQGRHDETESLYQRLLATPGNSEDSDIVYKLAKLYARQGKYKQAELLLKRASSPLQNWKFHWDSTTKPLPFSSLSIDLQNKNYRLSFYSLRNTPEEAFYFLLGKGLLLRKLAEINFFANQSPNPAIQNQNQELKIIRTQISNLVVSNKNNKTTEIETLEEKGADLERHLYIQLYQQLSRTEITSKEVLKKLRPEQVLIDFLVYTEIDLKTEKERNKQVIALIADKQKGIKLIKLGEFAPIAAAIKTYQTAIVPTQENANSREKTITQTAQTLYQKLWQPLKPYLQNKKTVYLIPDGDLHLLPFKALQDPDGKYLAEKWQLITLSSARDIVLPPLEGKASQAAIFAAPDYGDDTAIINAGNTAGASELKQIHFKPLASAFNEGQRLNLLFKNKQPAQLFTEKQATEQAISAVTAPKILHLATHGFFLADIKPDEKTLEHGLGLMRGLDQPLPVGKIENPLTRSGLAFANANLGVKGIKQADNTDGILTALEVLNLNLEGTDLVTLSACETGKGDVKIGEGVYSLNRAFQEAGAKAVLSTLWQVDDKATSEFMQKFYTRFLNGEPAQQAIQATQNEFMQHEKYRNPFYWAGFVMTGKE